MKLRISFRLGKEVENEYILDRHVYSTKYRTSGANFLVINPPKDMTIPY